MSYVHLFVTLKITDNVAHSAYRTIQKRLGIGTLSSLRRSDFWELGYPGLSFQQALQTTERLVTKTSLFVNPNKHDWFQRGTDQPIEELGLNNFNLSSDAAVLVCDREDGVAESTLEALERLAGENSEYPSTLRRGVWWDLTFKGLEPSELMEAAEKIAFTQDRHQGLLANPHYQTYRIFSR